MGRERRKIIKLARLSLYEEAGYLEVFNRGAQIFERAADGKRFQDLLADAGFKDGERVVVLSEEDFAALEKAAKNSGPRLLNE